MPTPDVPAAAVTSAVACGHAGRTVLAAQASYYQVNLRLSPKVGAMPLPTTQHDARRPEGAL
jgi:hypothetical protein